MTEQAEVIEAEVEAQENADQGAGESQDEQSQGQQKEPTWGDDWRARMAGGDDAAAKRLERFQNPEAVAKSLIEAQDKIRAGVKPLTLGDDPSEEDVAAYREAMGIPAEPSGYSDMLEGIAIGEEDKDLVGAFMEKAHGANASPKVVQAAIEWYQSVAEAQTQSVAEFDATNAKQAEDALREAWGGEYRSNMNAIENYKSQMGNLSDGNPLAEALMTARLGDGRTFKDSPEAMTWLMDVIKAGDPAAGVMPAGMGDSKSITDRIGEIEKVMRTDRSAYNKDKNMQQELLELYEAREKLASR